MSRTLRVLGADGRVICERCAIASNPLARMRGLLGRRSLTVDEGLLLQPATSIHTAFMRFPIDAVFLDRNREVKRVVTALQPWRTAACRGAREVVELAEGEAERRGLRLGERLELEATA